MRSESSSRSMGRRLGPWVTLATMLGALAVGALLNAAALAQTAASEPPGWQRSVAVFLTDMAVDVSDAVALDEPRDALEEILNRTEIGIDDGEVDQQEIFTPSTEQPIRLLAVGDSLMETIGAAVVNRTSDTGVVEARFQVSYSSGLARPELYDWPTELATALGVDTHVAVFMVGANDAQAISTASGFAPFGTAGWEDEYRARVGVAMSVLAQRTTTSYWIGLPVAADERISERFAIMNEVFRSEAAGRPTVHYIDVFAEFAADDGGYAPYLRTDDGRQVRVRDPDGIHFTPEGAREVAGLLLRAMAETWGLGEP